MPLNSAQGVQLTNLVQTIEGLTRALSEHNIPDRIRDAETDIKRCLSEQATLKESVKNLQNTAEEIQRSVDDLMAIKNKGAGILYAIGVAWTIAAIFLGAIASQVHWRM
jgi:hypothetical protein